MNINELRKKLLYQSTHRGCKELDIIMENFAKHSLNTLTLSELLEFDQLLKVDDVSLYNWIVGLEEAPESYHNGVLRKLSRAP